MGASSSSSRGRAQRPFSDPEVVEANLRIFEELKADPKFSEFLSFTFTDMKVGRPINPLPDGGLFEGEFTLMHRRARRVSCTLRIFYFGLLYNLSQRFPDGMLTGGDAVFPGFSSGPSSVLGGLILEDGRYAGSFAIVLRRVWGSLRALIILRTNTPAFLRRPPFKDACAKRLMLEIAINMRQLHGLGITHTDLSLWNVMVCPSTPDSLFPDDLKDDGFHVNVMDFETAVENSYVTRSKESDVFSYAYICSEILTGDRPFERVPKREIKIDYASRSPELPKRMDKWLRDLIERCWHRDPSQRPEFEEIVRVFKSKLHDTTTHAVEEEAETSTSLSSEISNSREVKTSTSYWSAISNSHEVETSTSQWSAISNSHEVETSTSNRSAISNSHGQDDLRKETNRQIFETLKQHPQFSNFFSYTFRNLKPGEQIAEGGQAIIFEAEFEKENGVKVPCVMKLFKHMSLREMVQQWPPGMLRSGDSPGHLRFGFMGLLRGASRTCEVLGAMVDENDDFAFIFNREGGDLRRLIDFRMRLPTTRRRPFKTAFAKRVMYEIALGLQHLHDRGILHRDLKAANVLVTNVFGEFPSDPNNEQIDFKVADFECSMLVYGTQFWRAPEILQQLGSEMGRTYTRASDVYSYGMTCYEVLTGAIPLGHLARNDYAAVCVRGERPVLPKDIDGWLKRLVARCWHSDPSARPEFEEIVQEFEKYCPTFLR